MKTANLTERAIRDAKPADKPFVIWDRTVTGFGVRVFPSGRKSYILNYRASGRERRATLAPCGALPLKKARERAGRELAAIRAGESDPLRRQRDARVAPTVADGLDRFFREFVPDRIAKGRLSDRTAADYRAQANRSLRPALGSMKIAEVARGDIEDAVAKCAPVQRNRTIAFASRLFSEFERWEWRAPNTNPAKRIERAREQPRDRVFAPTEIAALADALDRSDDVFSVTAIRFLMLTGWRCGEALALRWENVNFETGEITLPATKTGRDIRQVGAMASELLASLPRMNGNPFVFVGERRDALPYWTVQRRFAAACDAAGIADARLHDIRRTVATDAAAHGVSVFMLRDLLGHKTVAMANRYARRAATALQETQDATAARMAAMMAGSEADVIDHPARRRDA